MAYYTWIGGAKGAFADLANWKVHDVNTHTDTPATHAPTADDAVFFQSQPNENITITGDVQAGLIDFESPNLQVTFDDRGGQGSSIGYVENWGDTVTFRGDGSQTFNVATWDDIAAGTLIVRNAFLSVQSTRLNRGATVDLRRSAVPRNAAGGPSQAPGYSAFLGNMSLVGPVSELYGGPGPDQHVLLGGRKIAVAQLDNGNQGEGNAYRPLENIFGRPGALSPLPGTGPFEGILGVPGGPGTPPSGDLPDQPLRALDFGTVHVGDTPSLTYAVVDYGGPGAMAVQGAIQTEVNGGRITDPRLGGSGITPQNFTTTTSQDFTVTLDTSAAGTLRNQAIHVAYQFGAGDTVAITGEVLNHASPVFEKSAGPGVLRADGASYSIDLGDIRQGTPDRTIRFEVANAATGPADALSGVLTAAGDAGTATGTGAFADVQAGQHHGFAAVISTAAPGSHSEVFTLQASGTSPGFGESFGTETLTIIDRVV
jgi:hypothetical protein